MPSKPFLTYTNQVDFWSESDHAVRHYQVYNFPGLGVRVRDMDHETLHSLDEVLDVLSDVVYPTLAAYRADAGWYLVDVLAALGVDLDSEGSEPESNEDEPAADPGELAGNAPTSENE